MEANKRRRHSGKVISDVEMIKILRQSACENQFGMLQNDKFPNSKDSDKRLFELELYMIYWDKICNGAKDDLLKVSEQLEIAERLFRESESNLFFKKRLPYYPKGKLIARLSDEEEDACIIDLEEDEEKLIKEELHRKNYKRKFV
jgi:hypothetical protein